MPYEGNYQLNVICKGKEKRQCNHSNKMNCGLVHNVLETNKIELMIDVMMWKREMYWDLKLSDGEQKVSNLRG